MSDPAQSMLQDQQALPGVDAPTSAHRKRKAGESAPGDADAKKHARVENVPLPPNGPPPSSNVINRGVTMPPPPTTNMMSSSSLSSATAVSNTAAASVPAATTGTAAASSSASASVSASASASASALPLVPGNGANTTSSTTTSTSRAASTSRRERVVKAVDTMSVADQLNRLKKWRPRALELQQKIDILVAYLNIQERVRDQKTNGDASGTRRRAKVRPARNEVRDILGYSSSTIGKIYAEWRRSLNISTKSAPGNRTIRDTSVPRTKAVLGKIRSMVRTARAKQRRCTSRQILEMLLNEEHMSRISEKKTAQNEAMEPDLALTPGTVSVIQRATLTDASMLRTVQRYLKWAGFDSSHHRTSGVEEDAQTRTSRDKLLLELFKNRSLPPAQRKREVYIDETTIELKHGENMLKYCIVGAMMGDDPTRDAANNDVSTAAASSASSSSATAAVATTNTTTPDAATAAGVSSTSPPGSDTAMMSSTPVSDIASSAGDSSASSSSSSSAAADTVVSGTAPADTALANTVPAAASASSVFNESSPTIMADVFRVFDQPDESNAGSPEKVEVENLISRFSTWFETQLLPSLEQPSMIILDRAKYHTHSASQCPDDAQLLQWSRTKLTQFMEKYNITIPEPDVDVNNSRFVSVVALRDAISAWIKQSSLNDPTVCTLAAQHGHSVVFAPSRELDLLPMHAVFAKLHHLHKHADSAQANLSEFVSRFAQDLQRDSHFAVKLYNHARAVANQLYMADEVVAGTSSRMSVDSFEDQPANVLGEAKAVDILSQYASIDTSVDYDALYYDTCLSDDEDNQKKEKKEFADTSGEVGSSIAYDDEEEEDDEDEDDDNDEEEEEDDDDDDYMM
jgi:hypothetical protein